MASALHYGLDYEMDRHSIERFLAKIEFTPTCWLWTAGKSSGYGTFVAPGRRQVKAHRVSYELSIGPIPDTFVVDHLCRVRNCVNPEHLEAVNEKTNILRGVGFSAVNAVKETCAHGHLFDEENTRHRRGRPGRTCRACDRARSPRRAKAGAA